MFTKSFFRFLAGFLSIVAMGVLGAVASSKYFGEDSAILANTEQGN